ncbi:MAG: hypothetical protein PHD15_01185 [Clostridia bacterium]|nr:hypothetical protein [Clostridia bacterium]MDD4386363.1 hypothetical protein [Clostridia bacterium]
MIDEIRDNPKLAIILLLTGILAVVIFAIFMLVLVWSPKKSYNDTTNNITNQNNNLELGNYIMTYINEKDVIEKYCENILNTFATNDVTLINNIMLPEYLVFRDINKSGLKDALTQKGVLGKILKFSDYKVANHPKYGKVLEINITTYDNTYNDKMLVIQKSPNDYKVSFDGFIGLDKNVKSVVIDGLKLDINEIKELSTLTSIKFTLTNVSGHSIIINKENNYENVYLQLTTNSEVRMSSTWLAGEIKELTNGYVVNLNTEFVTSGLTSGLAKSIVIKNVYDTLAKETKDIEFPIN